MAVAAYTDYFRIFALHPMEELHRQMLEGLPLNPIREERTFEVKGAFIVHMEFLYPSTPDDRDHVILVLFLVELVCCNVTRGDSSSLLKLRIARKRSFACSCTSGTLPSPYRQP